MEDIILKVEGLTKKYEKFSLNNISFSIPRGYIMGFVGRNGAGKSTTIKSIMGLIDYESGNINVFGLDNRSHNHEIKQRIGYVSEDQYFYDDVTAEWMGNFTGTFYNKWDKELFLKLLKRFDVDGSKKTKELSKGMKMKLSLAIALAHHPELLILDEPTSGLDPVVRSELLDLFLEIVQDERCSIFFSSHITSDIEKIADYITVIDNGSIIFSDEKDTVLQNWVIVKADNIYCREEICSCLKGVKKGEFGFSGITDDLPGFEKAFRRRFPEGSFKKESISLDELLVRLVKESGEND